MQQLVTQAAAALLDGDSSHKIQEHRALLGQLIAQSLHEARASKEYKVLADDADSRAKVASVASLAVAAISQAAHELESETLVQRRVIQEEADVMRSELTEHHVEQDVSDHGRLKQFADYDPVGALVGIEVCGYPEKFQGPEIPTGPSRPPVAKDF